tara:strand:- start:488 stop:664 length:177 start_codon:yes stop_codon:yes gene_type:complete
MNKILVYGATGDQGLPLIDELLKHGYKVRAASRNPDDFHAYDQVMSSLLRQIFLILNP